MTSTTAIRRSELAFQDRRCVQRKLSACEEKHATLRRREPK
jgi:hypothetical protein